MTTNTPKLEKSRINPPERKSMPWEEFYTLMRQRIVEVHDIINQRTIWLAISQSFFFGGYAGVANAPKEAKNALFAGQQDLLLWLIPSAALIACTCVFVGILARSKSLDSLQEKFDQCDERDDNYPPVDASLAIRRMEKFSILIMPLVFMGTWIFILAKQLMSL